MAGKAEGLAVEEEEKVADGWRTHYSSFHQILLVGEGDFSFSLSLALAFGSGCNIVATSLDRYDILIKNYKKAKSNLENLVQLGASPLHGVDATKMKLHSDLRMRKFDRIIFNFPHAGFHGREAEVRLIKMHRNLVHGFLKNASGMLRPYGEIHINHKTTAPFCNWNLEELASCHSLALIECVDFKKEDYPGYSNKRGAGPRWDEPFHLGECSTFKFGFTHNWKKKNFQVTPNLGYYEGRYLLVGGRLPITHFPSVDLGYSQLDTLPQCRFSNVLDVGYARNMYDTHCYSGLLTAMKSRNVCWVDDGYSAQATEVFRTMYHVGEVVRGSLGIDFETYMAEAPYCYRNHPYEIQSSGILQHAWPRRMLYSREVVERKEYFYGPFRCF